MRAVGLLNLRRLRQQPLRVLLAIVAIAAGTALLVGVLIDRASVQRSFSQFVDQRAGAAQLEVHGPGGPAGLDERVLPKVRAVDGVAAAAPIVQAVTIAETAAGDERYVAAFGVDCAIESVIGDFGCDEDLFTGLAGAFVTSPKLAAALGEGGVIRTDEGRLPMTNAFLADQLDTLNEGNIVAFSLNEAQRVLGHQEALTSILVVPEDGVTVAALRADLEAVIGEHNAVSEPGTIGGAEFADMLIALLLFMSIFGLAIGAQLVRNTVSLSLEERRRDLAVVGAIGAPARTLLLGTLVESAVLGVAGGLLGIVGGILMARPLVEGMSNTLDELTGVQISVHVKPFAVVAGVVLGVLTSVLAALGPARRAAGMDVAAELHGQARRDETVGAARGLRALVYLVLTGVGLTLAWIGQRDGAIEPWQPIVAYAGFALTAILSFRAAQHGAAPLLAALNRLPILRNGTARLALTNLAGEPRRTGVMITALAAAVGIGVVLGNLNGSIVAGSTEATEQFSGGTVYVSSMAANNTLGVEAKLSPAVLEQLRSIEGVAGVLEDHGFCGEHRSIGGFCVNNQEPDSTPLEIFRGRQSVREVFEHGEVLIGAGMARTRGLDPGDTFELPGRTGMRTMTVGAIWADPNNMGLGVTVPNETFSELYGERVPGSVQVVPAPGVTTSELDARIEAADLDPDLVSYEPDELAADFVKSIGTFVTPFTALQRGMLVVALIAVTSTLLLVGVQRRREHGLLLAVGMAPVGLGRMVLTEAGIVGIAASVLGTIAGIATYVAMIWVSPLFTGLSAPFRFDLVAPLVYGGVGLVFVLIGAALPAWRTARLDPAVALRYE